MRCLAVKPNWPDFNFYQNKIFVIFYSLVDEITVYYI
jgi:hypothetical protein